MSQLKIVMLHDSNHSGVGDVAHAINSAWAGSHGCAIVRQVGLIDPALSPSWNKIPMMLRELKDADWVLWMDGDAAIAGGISVNELITLAGDNEVMFSRDWNGLCAGVFLVRNSAWSKSFLEACLFQGELTAPKDALYDTSSKHEQNTFKAMVDNFVNVADKVGLLAESVIQNPTSAYSATAFAVHRWAGADYNLAVAKLTLLRDEGYSASVLGMS